MSNIEFKDAFSRYNIGVEVDFTNEIELIAGSSYSGPVVIDDALAMTIAPSAVPGASYRTYFVADGSNIPTLAGAFEHDSSSGYDNTAGAINLFELWHDGLSLRYAWSQFADEMPVLLSSAEIPYANRTQIVLSFTEELDEDSEPAPSDFTLTNSAGADSITAVEIEGATVTLTRERDEHDATITLSYAKGADPLKADATGVEVSELIHRKVAVQPSNFHGLTLVRLQTSGADVVETANGEGWDYSATEPNQTSYATCYARSEIALQDGEDGAFVVTMGCSDMEWGPVIGFVTDDSADLWEDITICAIQSFAAGHYTVIQTPTAAAMAPDVITGVPTAGDVLKVERAGSDLVYSLSTDGGETYTEFNREPSISAGKLYIFVQLGDEGTQISLPRVSGNWA